MEQADDLRMLFHSFIQDICIQYLNRPIGGYSLRKVSTLFELRPVSMFLPPVLILIIITVFSIIDEVTIMYRGNDVGST